MPDCDVISELLPHLSASEWRTPQQVAEQTHWSLKNVRRALTTAARVGIVRSKYVQMPGYRVMDPQPVYQLRERGV